MMLNLPIDRVVTGMKNPHVGIPLAISFVPEIIKLWAPAWCAAHSQAIEGTHKILYAWCIAACATLGPAQPPPNPPTAPAQPETKP